MAIKADAIIIKKVNIKEATENEWDNLVMLRQAYLRERTPGEPISSKEMLRREIEVESQSKQYQSGYWLIYSEMGNQAIATYEIFRTAPGAEDYEAKRDFAFFDIFVMPDYRRRGIASQLLELVASEIQKDSRTTLEAWISTSAGDSFMIAMQAKATLQMKTNRLYLSGVDWAMVEQWAQEGQARNPDTKLILTDKLPEDHLMQGYADLLMHIFGQMPKEDSSVFPENVTIESTRDFFEESRKQNYLSTTAFTLEPNGVLTAMTEVNYQSELPHIIHQGLTGVHLDAQGRGLGKWLKAVMLLEVRKHYSDAQFIDTSNANVNAPMLHINEKLGFKFHKQETTYKLHVADILGE